MDGVVRTRVGYAGGTKADPTYRRMGDHTECIQVDYDPTRLSYDDLLSAFWSMHSPTSPAHSVQYASLVLAEGDEQLAEARSAMDRLVEITGRSLFTDIRPLGLFYPAEDYHQKYALRGDRVLDKEMHGHYPSEVDFRESTAAARLNGYLYGAGSADALSSELSKLGLSSPAAKYLLARVRT